MVNDTYNKPISIKDEEDERRAVKYIGAEKFPNDVTHSLASLNSTPSYRILEIKPVSRI